MHSGHPPYHEKLLHWIWGNRRFDHHHLLSNGGKQITVHQTGSLNKSDGPDFLNAEISIGKLRWHGDVEIHWRSPDWKAHGHHLDSNFKRVILHVVYRKDKNNSHRCDGSPVPTLCLSPHVDEPLRIFLEQYLEKPRLPCSGQITFISEKAFARQIRKAHKEYFEHKVNDLLEFYDPRLVPSEAWLKMLAIALFDGLGISHNRQAMQKLARALFPLPLKNHTAESLEEKAIDISGIQNPSGPNAPFSWKHKGIRPGNHPFNRIRQGAYCLWNIKHRPFREWMNTPPERLWSEMVNAIPRTPSLGSERAGILYGTVFLPALYTLGNLFFNERLKTQSWDLWQNHRTNLPASLLELLEQTDLSPSLYLKKLGTVHQLRKYCKPKNCQNCEVFKTAISS